jgi:hypothetical protein
VPVAARCWSSSDWPWPGTFLPAGAANAEDAAPKHRTTISNQASWYSGLSDADKKKLADLLGGSSNFDPADTPVLDPSFGQTDDHPYAYQGPVDLANPTQDPEPPVPPNPPDLPDWGPDDLTPPTDQPDPPQPPNPDDNGPDDLVNPTGNPDPNPDPNPNPNPSVDHSIPTPDRVDAGFGGAAVESHQAAGLALIASGLVLGALVVVIARRQRSQARSTR